MGQWHEAFEFLDGFGDVNPTVQIDPMIEDDRTVGMRKFRESLSGFCYPINVPEKYLRQPVR